MIILGCAGLAAIADIERELGVVVLDPTSVAFKVAEAMADLGLHHSKAGRYSYRQNQIAPVSIYNRAVTTAREEPNDQSDSWRAPC